MCDENILKEMVNDAVEKTLSKMFREFENTITKNMTSKMNVMSNSFTYIAKVLENSGIATTCIDKKKISWQTDMKNTIYKLVSINKESSLTYNSVFKNGLHKNEKRIRNSYRATEERI